VLAAASFKPALTARHGRAIGSAGLPTAD